MLLNVFDSVYSGSLRLYKERKDSFNKYIEFLRLNEI